MVCILYQSSQTRKNMKLKSLLPTISIVSILLLSCNTEHKEKTTVKKKTEISSQKNTIFPVKKLEKKKVLLDSVNNHKKNKSDSTKIKPKIDPKLKVIIDGKVYYKKNINDRPINISPKGFKPSKYIYHYSKSHNSTTKVYDIRTGRFVKNYVPII